MPWPAIADASREFENACGFKDEISLQNIYQIKYLTADGKLKYGSFEDIPGVVELALEKAKWNVDPKDVPETLRQAWRALEFGNYAAAAQDIRKSLKSPDAETQQRAKQFESTVVAEFKRQANPAAALARDGDFWPAYKEMVRVRDTFGDYELPQRFLNMIKKLEEKPEVGEQKKAYRDYRKARELMSSRAKAKVSIGRRRLKELIDEYPDSEAAVEARQIMGLKPKKAFR